MKIRLLSLLIAAAGSMTLTQSAFALTWNLSTTTSTSVGSTNFTSGSTNYYSNNNSATGALPSAGNTRTTSSGTGNPTVTAQAWSNTDQTSGAGQSVASTLGSSTNTSSYELESAYLPYFSGNGLGVENRDYSNSTTAGDNTENTSINSEHAVDNNQRNDMVLFSFGQAVTLTGLTIGYKGADSDMTVLAYTGSGTPTLTDKTYGSLTATGGGWSLVGHYADVATTAVKNINSLGISSSYWLIGAYNTFVTACTGTGCDNLTGGNDAIKLASLVGVVTPSPGKVPEPATLGLLGLGLLGMTQMRRLRKTS